MAGVTFTALLPHGLPPSLSPFLLSFSARGLRPVGGLFYVKRRPENKVNEHRKKPFPPFILRIIYIGRKKEFN
jgi:hypothetical protein